MDRHVKRASWIGEIFQEVIDWFLGLGGEVPAT